MTCFSSEGWQYGTAPHGPDRRSWLSLSANCWMSWDQMFSTFSEQMLRSVNCICTSHYTPMGFYWLIQALGHVFFNTDFWVFSLRKTKSNLENTLGQVRGTWRVKIKYITFQNWIMHFTIPYCSPDQIYCDLLWNSCFAFYDMVFLLTDLVVDFMVLTLVNQFFK